jgi:sarcosine oxidase
VKEISCEVAVVGGGINGLCTLYHLHRMGVRNLLLLEQFRVGHDRGSSHGKSRITRSAYVDRAYVRLMKVVLQEEWPRLERDLGDRFIHTTHGCFYGTVDGRYRQYASAVEGSDLDVEDLSPDEARRRFPLFRFPGADGVLLDRTAGLIAAERTLINLDRHLARSGVSRLENAAVSEIDTSGNPVSIRTSDVHVRAERVVVTAGPWAHRLLPLLAPRLTVARQTVGYFRMRGDPADFSVDSFPVWGSLAADKSDIFYGLPQFERDGIKIARHNLSDSDDDPDTEAPPPGSAIQELETFIGKHFTRPVESCLATETCYYTNTETEDLILDLHPENEAVAIGAGFSGHGFKFSPLTGRILAGLVMDGDTGIPEFESERGRFSIQGPRES